MEAALKDFRSAPIGDAEKALLAFIEKVTLHPSTVRQDDIDALHSAGWPDEAIYDAVNVCGLFSFYNRWVDATGVEQMDEEGYRASGRRLHRHGYVTPV